MSIPSSTNGYPVTAIGANAFVNTLVASVTIPSSVTSIGNTAFSACAHLTNAPIPASVTNIGDDVFYECTRLTAITVAAANPAFTNLAGVLFNKNQTVLLAFPPGKAGTYSVPGTVTNIGYDSFQACTVLTNLVIPGNVLTIGTNAFYGCNNLTNVTFNQGLASIGPTAFGNCAKLTSVSLPASVTNMDVPFVYCSSLVSITVAATNPAYASVGGVVFNKNLTTLIEYPAGGSGTYTIPNTVTNTGDAFEGCENLTGITIPNSVVIIGNYSFYQCGNLSSVVIPESVTYLGDYSFFNSGLIYLTIPNGVTYLGAYAFSSCFLLNSVTIGSGVTKIGSGCFQLDIILNTFYFLGNAPSSNPNDLLNAGAGHAIIHYLPGTAGWGPTFDGFATALWSLPYPLVLNKSIGLGASSNGFGFTISWATNFQVVVQTSTNLVNWTPLVTNTLANGTNAFRDTSSTNYPKRFYRVRSL